MRVYQIPWIKDTGNTVARSNEYVGEQLENTGPRAAPVNMARRFPESTFAVRPRFSWNLEDPALVVMRAQAWGNTYVSQRKRIIMLETYFQILGGIPRRMVDAFKRIVKSTIERARESVTINGYHLLFSPIDPASIKGSTGSTHGARIVRIPAIKETNASDNIDFMR